MTVATPIPALTVARCLAGGAGRLRAAGLDSARREARLLLAHATGRPADWLLAHPEAAVVDGAGYDGLIARRARREPLSRITGRREFWSLSVHIAPAVLDPRPDSETLVAAALDLMPERSAPSRVLDLGTGSGCLLLAVLSERPAATGLGVDLSPDAVAVARGNAARLGLAGRACFAVGDWGTGVAGGFDLVLCNPPYIPRAEIAGLAPEVAGFDPVPALDGGPDGLEAYRALSGQLARLLAPRGYAVLEIGFGQQPAVAAILARRGLEKVGMRADIAARPRGLIYRRAN